MAQIRANIVFEMMLASVLAAAAIAGGAHFLIGIGERVIAGAFSIGGAAAALLNAIFYAFFFFLAGFMSALGVGIPLYRAMEHVKLRSAWPYVLAAFAVGFIILTAVGLTPSVEAPARALHLVPGIAAALLFTRKTRPFWRAAANADMRANERAGDQIPPIARLH